jgi:hypothetical protein
MSAEEKRMVRQMHFEGGHTPTDIAESTGRHLSSICRTLTIKGPTKKLGRPVIFTNKKAACNLVWLRLELPETVG